MVVTIGVIIGFVLSVIFFGYVFYQIIVLSKSENNTMIGNIYKIDDDYWDDAGDGGGVNYVQMPDGSVRID